MDDYFVGSIRILPVNLYTKCTPCGARSYMHQRNNFLSNLGPFGLEQG